MHLLHFPYKKQIIMSTLVKISFLALLAILNFGKCIDEAIFRKIKGKYLPNSVFKTLETRNELHCTSYCSRDGSCVSVNFKITGKDQGLCELNNKRMKKIDDGQNNPEFSYHEIVTRKCNDKSKFFTKETRKCTSFRSCKDLLNRDGSLPNGIYDLEEADNSLKMYPVYCHMTIIPGCGPGGWTLVMKVDGNKNDFNYNSPYWTNKETYAVEDGLEGLNEKQTKLASYWNTPFKKICLGMKVSGVTKWIVIDHQASSLFNVIAAGVPTKTNAGKNVWKSLIASSSLQLNCNDEGFNVKCESHDVYTHVRIGFAANNEDNCVTCDSYIGFGASTYGCNVHSAITCGNFAICPDVSHYNADTKISAFGYILVQ